ncbi:hypothetical protein BB560_000860 [Smittium megazygosporum]|uniref:FAM192A/Fyv6 N-terminal domain-containing protein n=1 Tax=Smittium megazygosporum TaxID=133381 RepID=A0A2T9ZJ67_9FUNG|nr:hypothetical protein BB560_003669 [Smittium megazygosporum]PVV04628.1 hypothetical protein BB560_000860 [Smittium megazygosporum]
MDDLKSEIQNKFISQQDLEEIKQGKNKNGSSSAADSGKFTYHYCNLIHRLDDDELEFLDKIQQEMKLEEYKKRLDEKQELENFKRAIDQSNEKKRKVSTVDKSNPPSKIQKDKKQVRTLELVSKIVKVPIKDTKQQKSGKGTSPTSLKNAPKDKASAKDAVSKPSSQDKEPENDADPLSLVAMYSEESDASSE